MERQSLVEEEKEARDAAKKSIAVVMEVLVQLDKSEGWGEVIGRGGGIAALPTKAAGLKLGHFMNIHRHRLTEQLRLLREVPDPVELETIHHLARLHMVTASAIHTLGELAKLRGMFDGFGLLMQCKLASQAQEYALGAARAVLNLWNISLADNGGNPGVLASSTPPSLMQLTEAAKRLFGGGDETSRLVSELGPLTDTVSGNPLPTLAPFLLLQQLSAWHLTSPVSRERYFHLLRGLLVCTMLLTTPCSTASAEGPPVLAASAVLHGLVSNRDAEAFTDRGRLTRFTRAIVAYLTGTRLPLPLFRYLLRFLLLLTPHALARLDAAPPTEAGTAASEPAIFSKHLPALAAAVASLNQLSGSASALPSTISTSSAPSRSSVASEATGALPPFITSTAAAPAQSSSTTSFGHTPSIRSGYFDSFEDAPTAYGFTVSCPVSATSAAASRGADGAAPLPPADGVSAFRRTALSTTPSSMLAMRALSACHAAQPRLRACRIVRIQRCRR